MIKQIKNSYCCIGLMSGTSLDGLDIVLCQLTQRDSTWVYEIIKCTTIEYSAKWKEQLRSAIYISGKGLMLLHREYGLWLGKAVCSFLQETSETPDLVASHGHTIFHEPDKNFNFQLGDGNMIAATSDITTISDFRSLDICLNGQGAPLVPMGDKLLFPHYDACVNIGGFANVSCDIDGKRKAWDICPTNFIINRLVGKMGLSMDAGGKIGEHGVIIETLLDELNQLAYYSQDAPKSLAQEWVEDTFWPIIEKYERVEIKDIIRTCYEHFAKMISIDLNRVVPQGKVLFTGGGVYNNFLMQRIKALSKFEVIIPDKQLIDYKEAIVFALLGVLRYRGDVNCLSSVTGADKDCSSGVICEA